MPATRWERGFTDSDFAEGYRSWLETPIRQSPAAALVELAARLAIAESSLPRRQQCSWCQGHLDSGHSDARFPNVFCSKDCEREFVHQALAGISPDDAARMQKLLNALLTSARQPEVLKTASQPKTSSISEVNDNSSDHKRSNYEHQ